MEGASDASASTEAGVFEASIFQFDDFLRDELERDEGEDRQDGQGRSSGKRVAASSGSGGGENTYWRGKGAGEGAYEDAGEGSSSSSSATLYPSSSSLVTISDAMQLISDIFEKQVNKANGVGAPYNVAIRGDFEARKAFYTLLPTEFQRVFFLKFASQSHNWPRLRPLIGAPPYAFLRPQDAAVLNATGIAKSRTHMAYDDSKIVNYSQFGLGQWVDAYDREFRVVGASLSETDVLPSSMEQRSSSNRILLVCRVLKRSKQERVRRLRDAALKKTVVFPAVGETLTLRETRSMVKFHNRTAAEKREETVRVTDVKPREANASTAAVVAIRV